MFEKYFVRQYWEKLAMERFDSDYEDEIRRSVATNGNWSDFGEWSVARGTNMTIECVEIDGEPWYAVRVDGYHQFSTHTNTLDRAVEFTRLYFRLNIELLKYRGWSGQPESD